jgi:hypothetical protein
MYNITKVIIVNVSNPNYWYKDMIGKTFHIYGEIKNPLLVGKTSYTCVENSFFIYKDDVIFISN